MVDLRRPAEQLVRVRVKLDAVRLPLRVAMPSWTPGAYRRADWARNVRFVRAVADVDGREIALNVRRASANSWWLSQPRAEKAKQSRRPREVKGVTLQYEVYAGRRGDDSSYLDHQQATLVGASVFLFVPRQRALPHHVRFVTAKGWRLVTPLPRGQHTAARAPRHTPVTSSFRARDYDALIDAPVEAGIRLRVASVKIGGSLLSVAVSRHGQRAYALARRLVSHLRTIARAQRAMMGPLPYKRYLVGLHFRTGYRFTGLEHEGGTVVYAPQSTLDGKSGYRDLLHVLAHEHFHLWNGKRIRPAPHARYDYLKLKPSRALWLTEGCTEYFARRTLRRIGAFSATAFLDELGRGFDEVRQAPERARLSLSDIAYRAFWPPRDPSQTELSYYAKGQVACLMIDLELRARSGGRSGMLSVMRELSRRAQQAKPNTFAVDRQVLLDAIKSATKVDLTRELARWVDRPGDIDIARQLARFGVRVTRRASENPDYGFDAERRARGILDVSKVRRGGPAARAGLIPGDRILTIDGKTPRVWPGWHHQLRPQKRHRLQVLRAGKTMTLGLLTGKRKTWTFKVEAPRVPTALYLGWNR